MASYSRGVVTEQQWDSIVQLLRDKKVVNAIKEWRSITGDGLKESKYVCDMWRDDNSWSPDLKDPMYGVPLPALHKPISLMTVIVENYGDMRSGCPPVEDCSDVNCSNCIFIDTASSEGVNRDEEMQKKMLHDLILKGDIIV